MPNYQLHRIYKKYKDETDILCKLEYGEGIEKVRKLAGMSPGIRILYPICRALSGAYISCLEGLFIQR